MPALLPQTGVPFVDWFLALMGVWGYAIVFGFTIFENLFAIGSVTPGETVVIAGALVAVRGLLYLPGVWIASVCGTIVGSNISYWLGKSWGLDRIADMVERASRTRLGKMAHIDVSGVAEVEAHFHKHGSKTVLISRFAIGAKNFVPALAGATKMPVFWFELYTVFGAILYTSLMCLVGVLLGENLDRALKVASGIGWAGLGVLLLFFVVIFYSRWRLTRKRMEHGGEE